MNATRSSQRDALLDTIRSSISPAALAADAIATKMRASVQRVSRIRFGGAVLATVSGGITGIMAPFSPAAMVQALTAFAAMLGGIAAITADQFELAPGGLKFASTEEYTKIIELRSGLELLRLKVAQDSVRPLDASALDAMLNSLNDYSIQIDRWKVA